MESQTQKLLSLLQDGLPHRTDEILLKVYGSEHLGLARIGARCFDLRKKGYVITGWRDEKNSSLYWYQMIQNGMYGYWKETTERPSDRLPAQHCLELNQPRLFELSEIKREPTIIP